KRFWRRSDDGPRGRLATVRGKSDQASDGSCRQLFPGLKGIGRSVRDKSGDGHADERVQSIPYQVECGNLVGEEFDREQQGTPGNHRPPAQKLKTGRKVEGSGAPQDPQRRDGRVHIQSRGKTHRGDQAGKIVGGELDGNGHALRPSDAGQTKRAAMWRPSHFKTSYRVDSISKPHASSNCSGMYFEFLFLRAHSRRRVERKYWSGESLYSRTTCSNSVTVGITGPMGSGFPQFGFPRRLAIMIRSSKNKFAA